MFAYLVVVISMMLFGSDQEITQPVSICKLLSERSTFNGKMITLVGRHSSWGEGAWIEGECEIQLKTGPCEWRNCVWLKYDPSSDTALSGKSTMRQDALRKALQQIMVTTKLRNQVDRWAIVHGRFQTHDKLEVVFAPDGISPVYVGFGHLGLAPGEIVFKKSDIRLLSEKEAEEFIK